MNRTELIEAVKERKPLIVDFLGGILVIPVGDCDEKTAFISTSYYPNVVRENDPWVFVHPHRWKLATPADLQKFPSYKPAEIALHVPSEKPILVQYIYEIAHAFDALNHTAHTTEQKWEKVSQSLKLPEQVVGENQWSELLLYLHSEYTEGKNEFRLFRNPDSFYIHPMGKDGKTFDAKLSEANPPFVHIPGETFILEPKPETDTPDLPMDEEVAAWFETDIGIVNDCSASSAIYKFRLWLKDRKRPEKDTALSDALDELNLKIADIMENLGELYLTNNGYKFYSEWIIEAAIRKALAPKI